ncbi:hypothetical protein RYX36_012139 [Vicia faba]
MYHDRIVEIGSPIFNQVVVIFLAFDVFFAIFCVVLACLIGIALCCCLPRIIAILYDVAGQDGASEAGLNILPKYRFQLLNNEEKASGEAGLMVPTETSSGYLANERIVLPEDAVPDLGGSVATGNDQTVTKRRKVVEDDDNDNDKETKRNKIVI